MYFVSPSYILFLKYYFCYNSFLRKNVAEIFLNDYDDFDVFDNGMSAIMLTAIDYIERNEPRKSFFNISQKIVCVHGIYLNLCPCDELNEID